MKVQHKQKIKLLKSLACITITVYLVSFTGPAASQSEQPVSSKDIFSNSKQNPDADWLNKIIGSKIKVSFSKKTDITSIEKGLKVIAEIPGIAYGKVSGRLNMDENGKTAEFIPHSNLISWLNYKVTIADARDTQGNPLKDDEWSAEKKPEKTFNNFDLNSDGFISPDEVDWQDKIAYFDHDGDNAVSHEEWESAVAGISIVINEVLAKSAQSPDWIEFYNAGNTDADLSNWVLKDDNDSHIFNLPEDSVLKPGEFLVIQRNDDGITGFDFGLGSGDAVRLFNANNVIVDSTEWQDGNAPENRTWGRFPDGTGEFATLSAPTKGMKNKEPENNLTDPSAEMFDPTKIIEINIQISPEDWSFICSQNRFFFSMFSGEDCMDQPFESPFIYKPATVTINGTELANVGVRKKGFLSSLNDIKPSLKIKFDKYTDDQEFSGLDRLTLNNDLSDPSHMRQFLGYKLFAKAGVPAPRCNFAHVTVNGKDLGIYSNVESVKKRFLARHFSDNDGRLYEGTLSDFREGWTGTFEAKTNKDDPDRSDINAMTTALNLPDNTLAEALTPLINIDRYINFWAAEMLINHVDGYAGNSNNFFIYNDPTTGLLEFIPWGIDHTFHNDEPRFVPDAPKTVLLRSKLPYRLYNLPVTRDKYLTQLKNMLNTVWDEAELLAETDRIYALIAPYVSEDPFGTGKTNWASEVAVLRDFINGRRADLNNELELDTPPSWDYPLTDTMCDFFGEPPMDGDCENGDIFEKDGVTYICADGKWVEGRN